MQRSCRSPAPPIEQACYWLARAKRPAPRPPSQAARKPTSRSSAPASPACGPPSASRRWSRAPRSSSSSARPRPTARAAATPGILGDTIDHSHGLAVAHFGREEAARLATLGRENVADLAGLPGHPRHRLRPGAHGHPARGARLPASSRTSARTRPAPVRWASRTSRSSTPRRPGPACGPPSIRARSSTRRGPPSTPSSWWTASPARPSGEGSASSSTRRSRASRRQSAGLRLRTPSGEVAARRAVQATSAYSHELRPALRHRFIPLYDYVLVSEPLRAGAAGGPGVAGARGRDRRAHLLQLLPPHRRRSRALGHERGRLLQRQPRGRGLRPLGAPLPRAARELRPPLPRPGRPRVPLRLGRTRSARPRA